MDQVLKRAPALLGRAGQTVIAGNRRGKGRGWVDAQPDASAASNPQDLSRTPKHGVCQASEGRPTTLQPESA
ncbi:hypothetical protein [Deinococcus marmoris]|uniref:hypothetical protein n=1 Tax=Deinococcus marmoris TaxID=249408 RepID=UPI0004953BB9|nr:hypothetical protein [Deinococcus marmoris]